MEYLERVNVLSNELPIKSELNMFMVNSLNVHLLKHFKFIFLVACRER
jgi:hypothetical protein